MGFRGSIASAIIAALVLALVIVATGCGDSSSGASDAEATETSEVELATPSEGDPSRAFLKKGAKNKIATFGAEASAKERETASRVLEESLHARQAGEWAKQCSTLSAKAVKDVAELAAIQGVGGGGCTKELKARAEPLQISKDSRENSLSGPIDALRVKGTRGYALYHGVGADFAMSMEFEDGEWKVGDVLEVAIGE